MQWTVQRLFVLISAIVWPDGTPVTSGRVTGAVGEAATDESGFLQADVIAGAHLRIETVDREEACLIRVPMNPEKEDFIVLDELVCEVQGAGLYLRAPEQANRSAQAEPEEPTNPLHNEGEEIAPSER